ncbi:hypothetical protein D3C75_1075370 [compost metagenome]
MLLPGSSALSSYLLRNGLTTLPNLPNFPGVFLMLNLPNLNLRAPFFDILVFLALDAPWAPLVRVNV